VLFNLEWPLMSVHQVNFTNQWYNQKDSLKMLKTMMLMKMVVMLIEYDGSWRTGQIFFTLCFQEKQTNVITFALLVLLWLPDTMFMCITLDCISRIETVCYCLQSESSWMFEVSKSSSYSLTNQKVKFNFIDV